VVSANTFDLVLFEELSEAILESLEAEIDFVDVVASFKVDDVFIFADSPSCSEIGSCFFDEFADSA